MQAAFDGRHAQIRHDDELHPGTQGSQSAVFTVLEHQTGGRGHVEAPGGQFIDRRIRLASGNFITADNRLEKMQHINGRQPPADSAL